jgi:hypothetical protein
MSDSVHIYRPDDCQHPAVTDGELLDADHVWRRWGHDSAPQCPDCRAHLYLHDDFDYDGPAEVGYIVHDDPPGIE